MKFGQLIEYNMGNSFPEKSCTKCGWETTPGPFSKQNWAYLQINFQKFHAVCFYFVSLSPGLPKYIKTTIMTTWFYAIQIFLKKQKDFQNKSPYLIFCIIFEEKYFSRYPFFFYKHSIFSFQPQYAWVLLNPPTTDPPTHRPPAHQPNDSVIMFKRLENSMIFTLQNINTAGKT